MNNLPVGQLYGSRHHLGNYDECMTSPWYDLHPELRTQYCLADVTLEVKEEEKRNVTTANPYGSTLDYMQVRKEIKCSNVGCSTVSMSSMVFT